MCSNKGRRSEEHCSGVKLLAAGWHNFYVVCDHEGNNAFFPSMPGRVKRPRAFPQQEIIISDSPVKSNVIAG